MVMKTMSSFTMWPDRRCSECGSAASLTFSFGNISHAMKPELTFAFGLILGCAVDPEASAQTPAGLDIQLCPSQVGKAGETRAPL